MSSSCNHECGCGSCNTCCSVTIPDVNITELGSQLVLDETFITNITTLVEGLTVNIDSNLFLITPPLVPGGPTSIDLTVTGTNGVTVTSPGPGLLVVNGQEYADFYALMPGDNAAPVALGAPVLFPQLGATSPGSGITALGGGQFNLLTIGTYWVNFQVSVTEPGQLVLMVNGVQLARSVAGRATGTSQIMNSFPFTTTVANTVVSLNNPAGNAAALTITPIAGGTVAVSAHLNFVRVGP